MLSFRKVFFFFHRRTNQLLKVNNESCANYERFEWMFSNQLLHWPLIFDHSKISHVVQEAHSRINLNFYDIQMFNQQLTDLNNQYPINQNQLNNQPINFSTQLLNNQNLVNFSRPPYLDFTPPPPNYRDPYIVTEDTFQNNYGLRKGGNLTSPIEKFNVSSALDTVDNVTTIATFMQFLTAMAPNEATLHPVFVFLSSFLELASNGFSRLLVKHMQKRTNVEKILQDCDYQVTEEKKKEIQKMLEDCKEFSYSEVFKFVSMTLMQTLIKTKTNNHSTTFRANQNVSSLFGFEAGLQDYDVQCLSPVQEQLLTLPQLDAPKELQKIEEVLHNVEKQLEQVEKQQKEENATQQLKQQPPIDPSNINDQKEDEDEDEDINTPNMGSLAEQSFGNMHSRLTNKRPTSRSAKK